MKTLLITAAKSLACGSILATLPFGMAAAQSSCEDVLNNNVYECEVRSDFGTEFEDVFRFISPGSQSQDFDLTVDGLPAQIHGCECKARGSFLSPRFDSSRSFHCVSASGSSLSISFEGRASSRRIRRGEAVNEFGDSFVIQCKVEDPDKPGNPGNPTARAASPGNWSAEK